MKQKKETYIADDVLTAFYEDLLMVAEASNPQRYIDRIHIPMSDVFYVREAIKNNTGVEYSLDHVEWAMMKEGFLSPSNCFDGYSRMHDEHYTVPQRYVKNKKRARKQ